MCRPARQPSTRLKPLLNGALFKRDPPLTVPNLMRTYGLDLRRNTPYLERFDAN